jgi:glycosyltransferase involved in cell wall biosynthesis
MNILYITYLFNKKWAGPSYSVPNQIHAQSKYDNVFWYNVNDFIKDKQVGDIKCYTTIEYPKLKISELPAPFNKPDLVIFEGFYFYRFYKISKECLKYQIPYIVVPRSSLTDFGQKSKLLKKKVGNFLFFTKFAKKAAAIQYLTQKEFSDSTDKWNSNNLIIPNGINPKRNVKQTFNKSSLKGIFIGRLDIYQKGLDLFVEACAKLKDELSKNNCTIDIYGPEINGSKSKLEELIKIYGLEKFLYIKDGIFDDEKEKKQLESDFFILTSRFEGHPMGLIEALSYGLPCLVTTGSNMANEIEKVDAGWTCEIKVEDIIKALKLLIKERELLPKKGKNALELSKKYNWESIAKLSNDKYESLIKNKN